MSDVTNDSLRDRNELYALLGDYANQTIAAAEVARLEQLLRSDAHESEPWSQQMFWDYMTLHAELAWRESGAAQLGQTATTLADPSIAAGVAPRRSPILGFLDSLARIGGNLRGEMAGASLFQWSVLGMIGAGMVTFLTLVGMLVSGSIGRAVPNVLRNGGPNEGGGTEVAVLPRPANVVAGDTGNKAADSVAATAPKSNIAASDSPAAAPAPRVYSARLIRVNDARWHDREDDLQPGADLFSGRKLQLESGDALFYFQRGAEVILHGPAQLLFLSPTSARLVYGSLTVKVEDPLSRGFEVHTPGMKFTDLGTEFGVSVARDGKQQMHVFRGRVAAEAELIEVGSRQSDRSGRRVVGGNDASLPTAYRLLPAPLVLTANQALRLAPGKPIEQIAANDRRFVRNMPRPEVFPLFSTGAGLDRGAADPHWELTKISTDPKFQRRPATVVLPLVGYARDSRDTAQWISSAKAIYQMHMPVGCLWTFITHFDLTGFQPSTARIMGRIAVDNFLAEVRLNGSALPLPEGSRREDLFVKWLELKVDQGFRAGDNVLEIVIENGPFPEERPEPNPSNPMAMCLDLKGMAMPVIAAATDD